MISVAGARDVASQDLGRDAQAEARYDVAPRPCVPCNSFAGALGRKTTAAQRGADGPSYPEFAARDPAPDAAWRQREMSLFRYFSKEATTERRRAAAQKRLSNMYYQSGERMAAAQEMAELAAQGDAAALQILLQRFEQMNPSTTIDRDEKDFCVDLLVSVGDFAVEGTKKYVKSTAEAIFWPMKFLQKALSEEDFTDFLAAVLTETSADYARDPKKKLGLVQLAGDHHNEKVREEILRFVDDHDEAVRFHAIAAALEITPAEAQNVLLERWANPAEDSGRIHRQIADAFIEKKWSVGSKADQIKERLPFGASINAKGVIQS